MKSDNLKRNDTQPPVISGEFVPVQSVVTVTNLAVTGPYRGDFQVIDEGRVIVGADPDLGPRGILSARALQGYNANGLNTFAVWFATTEQHAPGDFHAGNLGGNYLAYDQAAGTLGLYTPDGAGILMDNDGTFIAGHSEHGHMKWDAVTQSFKIMSGAETMAEIGDDGNAAFTGIITAQGGHITGRMFVDEVLQAGDSDGPAIYLGRFERTNAQNEIVETSEIIATDANNLPWFHVTAGGDTAGGGYFALGGQGDYAQRLTYDGANLVFDGTVYARGGEFTGTVEIIAGGTLVVAGEITFGGGRGKLDATGLKLETSQSGDEGYNEVQWFYDFANNAKVAGIQAESALGHTTLTIETAELYNDDDSVVASTIEIVPRSDTGGASSVVLRPTVGGVVDATLTINNSSVEAVGATSVSINNATTAAVDNLLTLNHNSTGTPAAFFGAGLAVNLKSTTTNSRPASTINTLWATPTHGAETAAVTINTVNGGNLTNVAKFGGTLGTVLNEDGNAWNDLRVEGDTDTHLIFVDASADRVGISEDAPNATLDVNGTARFGDSDTNYAQFDATGHLTFNGTAKPWNDILIEPTARNTGANAPSFEKWYDDAAGTSRGVYLYSFDDANAGSEKEVFFNLQMSHAWDGGDIQFHVHWIGAVADTTATPRWGLEYVFKEPGAVFGDSTIIYATGNHLSEADITANKHYITAFAAITGGSTANDLSSVLIGRLFRDSANAADTYNATGAKCGLLYIDAHYQIARIGSTDEYSA